MTGDLPRLAAPAQRALASAGIRSLGQMAMLSEAEMMALHGMGPKALGVLKAALAAKGLAFRR